MSPETTTATASKNRKRTSQAARKGRIYTALGWVVVAAFVGVGLIAFFNPGGLGLLDLGTAMIAIGVSIAALAVGLVIALFSLRSTLTTLERHEARLVAQAEAHADLARDMQAQRDREQDEQLRQLSEMQSDMWHELEKAEREASHAKEEAVQVRASALNRRPRATEPGPFGDIHPVIDVEGIGEVYSKGLKDIGVETTEDLWRGNATYIAGHLAIEPSEVTAWQQMAELMAVKGIGPQYAELLVRAGVDSINALRRAEAEPLFARASDVNTAGKQRIQRGRFTAKTVQAWIDAARAHKSEARTAVAAR